MSWSCCCAASLSASALVIAVSAIEDAEIWAVMDANDNASLGFMADANLGFMAEDAAVAAVAGLNAEPTVLLCSQQQRKVY